MSEVEKRSVHTDALATLGTIIGEDEKRDAIHLAVEPAVAAHPLHPGDDVGFVEDGVGACDHPVGIVDPFLKDIVKKGQRFWLIVYPRQITSLRHVWSHPAFVDEPAAVIASSSTTFNLANYFEKRPDEIKQKSEAWLRKFCDKGDCPGYETVMELIEKKNVSNDYGRSYMDEQYLHFDGRDAHGEIPAEFWHHVEVVTGKIQEQRPVYFSCSC